MAALYSLFILDIITNLTIRFSTNYVEEQGNESKLCESV